MRIFQILFFSVLFLFSCGQEPNESTEIIKDDSVTQAKNKETAPEFTVLTVEYPETGWGYQILQDGKIAIDQKHIPVIQGYKGFTSREKAEKTATFIVEKMKKGVFPPTLTETELDSLKVL